MDIQKLHKSDQRHVKCLINLAKPELQDDNIDNFLICLRNLEDQAHKLAERHCDDPTLTKQELKDERYRIKGEVKSLFGRLPEGFFINGDPRGRALKIHHEKAPKDMQKDWGGFGMVAPSQDIINELKRQNVEAETR